MKPGYQSIIRNVGILFLGAVLIPSAIAHTTATPGVCYASTGNNDFGRLLTIDLATGAGTLVGDMAIFHDRGEGVPALAINSNGEIFVMDEQSDAGLYRVDAANAAVSFMGRGTVGSWTSGMAFDENDVLYGQNWDASDFYTIDTANGLETVIANDLPSNTWVGMAFDPTDGTLWASLGSGDDEIYTIDKTTGVATFIGFTGLGGSTPDIAFDAAGNLYGLKGGGGTGNNNLISINKSTGAGTVIGPTGFTSVSGMDCFEGVPATDTDGDGVPDDQDICPLDFYNDSDGDGSCDSVDLCLGDDASGDSDSDGLCDNSDPCIGASNSDADGDGVCDDLDACEGDDASGDTDGDGVCDDLDACEGDDASGDTDGDLFCNNLDICPLDEENDADGDGVCESDDNCPVEANTNQSDLDEDGVGDLCDDDIDGDGALNGVDNCVFDVNSDQADFDSDGEGDVCDNDIDGDGVVDAADACVPTPIGEVVGTEGCSIVELCPCENNWKNHGAYVRCVAHTSEDFVDAGLISEAEKDAIVSAAGQSECGHKK